MLLYILKNVIYLPLYMKDKSKNTDPGVIDGSIELTPNELIEFNKLSAQSHKRILKINKKDVKTIKLKQ